MLTYKYRLPLPVVAFLILIMASAFSSVAQSTEFDNPTSIVNGVTTGVLPEGAPTARYFSFVAGPGEVHVTFEIYDADGTWIIGQLSDAYGRALVELNQKEEKRVSRTEVSEVVITNATLPGRYFVPKRQKLVVKIASNLYQVSKPVRYRIIVSETPAPASPTPADRVSAPVGPTTGSDLTSLGSKGSKSVTRRSTSSPAGKTRPISCLAEYQACLKRSIVLGTSKTSQCIVQRAYCERRQRVVPGTSGSQQPKQGVGEASGRTNTIQRSTRRRSK